MLCAIACAALVALAAGCNSDGVDPPVGTSTALAEVRAARAAWQADGVDDYRLAYGMICECEPGTTVTVRDGEIVRLADPHVQNPYTVDRLFEVAIEVLEGGNPQSEVRLGGSPAIPVYVAHRPNPEVAPGVFVADLSYTIIVERFDRN